MFNIGDRIKVKKEFFKIWELVYSPHFITPAYVFERLQWTMAGSIGKTFTIGGRVGNSLPNFKTKNVYLLVDDKGDSDGFAWAEEFLERDETVV